MNLIRKFVDLLLYSNLWIALAAVAMCLQSQYLLFGKLTWSPFLGFVFCATLSLYATHRIIELERVKPFRDKGRYGAIVRLKQLILVAGIIAAVAGAWFFFHLDGLVQLLLIFPCLVGAAYVLPVLGGRKRVRDLHHIKAFLVVIAWAWVTVTVPAAEYSWAFTAPAILMLMERICFLFALILPFDIRDLKVDAHTRVKTLPSNLGIKRTKILAAFSLLLMLAFAGLNYQPDVYPPDVFTTFII